jgi:nucleoside-diphosphate-sugar epimerase
VIKNANVLMTGARSFVGQDLLSNLAARFDDVYATTRSVLKTGSGYFPSSINYLPLNIEIFEDYENLPQKVNTIIHLAAERSTKKLSASLFRSNMIGTYNLVNYARRAKAQKFIFASSMSVYGKISDDVVNSKTLIVDPDLYGLSKRLGELFLFEAARDFPSVSLRLPSVLGAGARGHWLSQVLLNAKNNKRISIFNPDASFNNAVSTNCLNNFLIRLCESGLNKSMAMPLASSGLITVKKAVETVIEASNSNSKILVNSTTNKSFSIDCSEACEYGFEPKHIEDVIFKYARS